MNKEITIAGRKIGQNYPPYLIAEMSANHNGSIENAYAIINEAKDAGVDAIKIQTYLPSLITLKSDLPDFQIHEGLWAGRTLYDLYESAHTPWEWHKSLFDHAHRVGLQIFSSPFDKQAIDLLEDLNTPAYKIASFEAIDLPLIKYAASTGKPLIISTGMANADEIEEAVEAARSSRCKDLAVLHCVSGYPAPAVDYNLRTIPDMAQRFGTVVGLSDHTIDNTVAIASVGVGACVIEKHFTLNRNGGGPDDSFSIEPKEMKALCAGLRNAWAALGRVHYERKSSELKNMKFRRSLYTVKMIKAGEHFTEENFRSIRPGFGLPPKFYDNILGKQASKDLPAGTPLKWEFIC